MAQDGQNSKKPLDFVHHEDDLIEHQAFLLDLVAQGKDAWNLWRNEHLQFLLNFSSMEFPRETSFNGFEFGNLANFSEATFGNHANFSEATFGDFADFTKATFGNHADFSKATFGDGAEFREATFGDYVFFRQVTFGDGADFRQVTFSYGVDFREATFGNFINYSKATFGDHVSFMEATFGDHIYFRHSVFPNILHFDNAKFGTDVHFNEASFGTYTSFQHSTFGIRVAFDLLTTAGSINLANASFAGVPAFTLVSEDEKLKFEVTGMTVGLVSSSNDIVNLQKLRGIAESRKAENETRDWFILQRRAERSKAWEEWYITIFNLTKKTTPFPLPQSIMAGLFWILSDYGRSVVRPIAWLLLSIPLFYYLYLWLYPAKLKMVAQRDALLDYTLSSSIPFGRLLNPAFDRAFETLFPRTHHQIIGTVDITIGFQIASIAQGIVSVILLFLIGLSIRNYFKIS